MDKILLEKLKEAKNILKEEFGIEKIAIFGSFARNEEKENSDIDIVILKMKRKNGFLIAKAKRFLNEYLNTNVDIGLYDSMHPYIKKEIKKDMIYV
ncbi:nucleotidyltransferase family protein [Nitrosophilus kaiyonis]|uniref:nucleotidyltransferase family protein n=1 Tax=Nitrosophilus kaiyonis TaxID=2930200 RepID=UPI0024928D4F|nr:nucleotidyltransferase domain-containing protein [Nitrosophilus kaiyonis]